MKKYFIMIMLAAVGASSSLSADVPKTVPVQDTKIIQTEQKNQVPAAEAPVDTAAPIRPSDTKDGVPVLSIIILVLAAGELGLLAFFLLKYLAAQRSSKSEIEMLKISVADKIKETVEPLKSQLTRVGAGVDSSIGDAMKKLNNSITDTLQNNSEELKRSLNRANTSNPVDGIQSTLKDFEYRVQNLSKKLEDSASLLNNSTSALSNNSSAFGQNIDSFRNNLQTILASVKDAELLQDIGQIKKVLQDAVNEIGDRKALEIECNAAKSEVQAMKEAVAQANAVKVELDSLRERAAALQTERDQLNRDLQQIEIAGKEKLQTLEQECQTKIRTIETELTDLKQKTAEQKSKFERYEAMDQQAIPDFIRNNSGLANFLDELQKQLFSEDFSAALRFKNTLSNLQYLLNADTQFNTESWIQFKILGKTLNMFLRKAGKSESDIADTMKIFAGVLNDSAPMIKTPNGSEAKAFTVILPSLGQSINVVTTTHTANGSSAEKILNWGIIDARGNCQIKAEVA